ncbi:MAG TPA: hypothetical protein ENI94_12855 [Gammaproteobacteria bacterium]|nr:hypothetical protein [Gammaproteobacteria bacterium]
MSGFVITGINRVRKELERFDKKAAFAGAQMANYLANKIRDAEKKEMQSVFKNPTPWTLNSTRVTYARKNSPQAVVWLKDEAPKGTPATKYLAPQIFGGRRNIKRFELALQHAGVMPTGWVSTPGQGAKLDRYGNMSRGQIVQIMSWFQAHSAAGYTANTTAEGKRRRWRGTRKRRGYAYFAVNPQRPNEKTRHLQPGIYMRINTAFGSAIKPVLIFAPSASYSKRYRFFGVAERTHKKHLDDAMRYGFKRAFG